MGRVRNLFDLALAVGAIAGSFAVLSPHLLWRDTDVRSLMSAQATSVQATLPQASDAQTTDAQKGIPLAPLVGIAQFVKAPNNYSIVIDRQIAKVTDADLKGDLLEIDYVKTTGNQATAGKLKGTLDSNGVFTEARQSVKMNSGEHERVSFAFEADGTAKTVKGDRIEAIYMLR